MIVKLGGKYLVWSKVVDAPITFGMTRSQLTAYVAEEEGRRGVEELAVRLKRCDEKGTSSLIYRNAVEVVWFNRAGAGETCMTIEQLVEHFVTNPSTQAPPKGENESGGDNPDCEGGGPAYPKHWEGRTP